MRSKSSTAQGPTLVQTTLASSAEDAVEVDLARAHQPVGEQVQAQVDVGGVDRGGVEVDLADRDVEADVAVGGVLLAAGEGGELVRRGGGRRLRAELRLGVPGVEDPAGRGPGDHGGGQAVAPRAALRHPASVDKAVRRPGAWLIPLLCSTSLSARSD